MNKTYMRLVKKNLTTVFSLSLRRHSMLFFIKYPDDKASILYWPSQRSGNDTCVFQSDIKRLLKWQQDSRSPSKTEQENGCGDEPAGKTHPSACCSSLRVPTGEANRKLSLSGLNMCSLQYDTLTLLKGLEVLFVLRIKKYKVKIMQKD